MKVQVFDLSEQEDTRFVCPIREGDSDEIKREKFAILNLDLLPGDDVMESERDVYSCLSSDKLIARRTSAVMDNPISEFPGIFEDSLSQLVNRLQLKEVIDFGSGDKKRMCKITTVVEHVEFKKFRTMCNCGCGIVPFITPFHKHTIAQAVVCVNSLQNNHVMWQRLFLQQVKFYKKKCLVVVPVKLGLDEFDPMHVIMSELMNVQEGFLTDACLHKYYYYDPECKDFSVDQEINVSASGLPVVREFRSSRAFNRVLMQSQISGPEKEVKLRSSVMMCIKDGKVQVVAKDSGCVDFVAAGHVKWGEIPSNAMSREWSEEVETDLPKFFYLGRVDATVGYGQAYVYFCFVDFVKCVASRGFVRDLRVTDIIRDDMIPALLMIKSIGVEEVDVVVNNNLARKVYSRGKNLTMAEKTKIVKSRRTAFEMIRTSDRIQVVLQEPVKEGDMIAVQANRWQTQVATTFSLINMGREVGTAMYVTSHDKRIILRVVSLNLLEDQQLQPLVFTVDKDFIFVQENRAGIKYVQSQLKCDRESALRMIRSSTMLPRKSGDFSDIVRSTENLQDVIGLGGGNHKGDGPRILGCWLDAKEACFVDEIGKCEWDELAVPRWSWLHKIWFFVSDRFVGSDKMILGLNTFQVRAVCFGEMRVQFKKMENCEC